MRFTRASALLVVTAVSVLGVAAFARGGARPGAAVPPDVRSSRDRADQEQPPRTRTIAVTAKKYVFAPQRIEVTQDDLVRITLTTEDIAHSFTVDSYRIAKRAAPNQPVTFEFRADRPGTFPFYCDLTIDDGCRKMRGELVVKAK